jgi:hypothetical protein
MKDRNAENKIVIITGIPGSGKSYYIGNVVIPDVVNRRVKTLIVDPAAQFDDTPKGIDVYRPSKLNDIEVIERICEQIMSGKMAYHALIIDESNLILPKHVRPIELPNWTRLSNMARHYDLEIYLVARRPAQVYTDSTQLAGQWVAFTARGDLDLAKLDEMEVNFGTMAHALEEHEFLILDSRCNIQGPFVVKNKKVVPSGRTIDLEGKKKAKKSSAISSLTVQTDEKTITKEDHKSQS